MAGCAWHPRHRRALSLVRTRRAKTRSRAAREASSPHANIAREGFPHRPWNTGPSSAFPSHHPRHLHSGWTIAVNTDLRTNVTMTKIDIKESEGGGGGRAGSSKSPSPARREAGIPLKDPSHDAPAAEEAQNKNSDKNREGVSNESGYFEDEEEAGASGTREDSIEIIFDKNASNNNSGQAAEQTGRTWALFISAYSTQNLDSSHKWVKCNIYFPGTQGGHCSISPTSCGADIWCEWECRHKCKSERRDQIKVITYRPGGWFFCAGRTEWMKGREGFRVLHHHHLKLLLDPGPAPISTGPPIMRLK